MTMAAEIKNRYMSSCGLLHDCLWCLHQAGPELLPGVFQDGKPARHQQARRYYQARRGQASQLQQVELLLNCGCLSTAALFRKAGCRHVRGLPAKPGQFLAGPALNTVVAWAEGRRGCDGLAWGILHLLSWSGHTDAGCRVALICQGRPYVPSFCFVHAPLGTSGGADQKGERLQLMPGGVMSGNGCTWLRGCKELP